MKQAKNLSSGIFAVGIAALFLLGFLALVIFGAKSYKSTVDSQAHNHDDRAILSYLSAVSRSGDQKGAVYVESTDFGDCLVIEDEAGYALKIFQDDGQLLEDYTEKDSAPDPEYAQVIGKTESFVIEHPEEDLYRIKTDQGLSILYFRSEGGALR